MVAHQIPNGHPAQHQPFHPPPHNHPNGHFPIPSPAMSNQSLPGPNGSVHNQTPHLQHQPAPYNGAPYGDPTMFIQPPYQQYPPQGPGPQYNYPYFPNQPQHQMGGPGPATMHGYNGYPQNGYMPRQPVSHIPQPPQQHPGPQMNGPDGMAQPHFNQFPPPGEGFYSHPSQPPPPFGQPDAPYQQNYYPTPPYQHQPHQFPAGHPYAQGHGYGYPPPQPMHNGPNGNLYNHPPPPQFQHHNSRPPASKSLNPSAQVFRGPSSFIPSRDHQQSATASNSGRSPAPTQPAQPPVSSKDVMVNGNKQENAPAAGGLGLSQMEPAVSKAPSESGSTKSNVTQVETKMTPSMSEASGVSATTEGDVQTPVDDASTPTSDTVRRPFATATPRAGKLEFGSVPKANAAESHTVANANGSQTVRDQPTPTAAKATLSSANDRIRVSKGRPSHLSSAGVTFSVKSLVTRNPEKSPVQHVFLTLEPMGESKKTQRKSPGNVLVSMGTGNDTPARIVDTAMVIGEVTVEDIPAIVLRSPRAEKPSVEEPVKETSAPVEKAAPVPAPAPKAKPSSWAALLKPKTHAHVPSDTMSAGPSSVRVSPSKSVISLATETNAQTEVDPITPRSVAPSLPPSASAGTPGPRPAFNYAAAAAIGRGITPQDELLKLLTDGLKVRPKGPPTASVPRGLINTGNMCYANTVSPHPPHAFKLTCRYSRCWLTAPPFLNGLLNLEKGFLAILLDDNHSSRHCKFCVLLHRT
jgi:ubiquitin carboxyl-terminal hydrolase 10